MSSKIKEVFAYYLPQFHEIEENNKWWGKGFTEWDNVKSASSIFQNHQIHYPSNDLGFYCLDDVSVIEKQYKIAKKYGVTSFCFWHYWFDDNDKILQKPAELLLSSNKNVKFCFAWANHSWFNKSKGILLKEQKYSFDLDIYFNYLLPFFLDNRYTRINNKPVFTIYDPAACENLSELMITFSRKAKENGLEGICFIAENTRDHHSHASLFDYYLDSRSILRTRSFFCKVKDRLIYKFGDFGYKIPRKYDYKKVSLELNKHIDIKNNKNLPIILPRWDSTIRHGKGGYYLNNSNPENFEIHVKNVADIIKERKDNVVFIKSWNEWAEGNYLEPCNVYGYEYLEIFSKYFK